MAKQNWQKELKKDLITIRNGAMITPILYKIQAHCRSEVIQKALPELLRIAKRKNPMSNEIRWFLEGLIER